MLSSDTTPVVRVVVAVALALSFSDASPASDPASALREQYLDRSGLPCPALYARMHGITPALGCESFAWRAVFRLTYRAADSGKLPLAEPVHTDCYFVRRRSYEAAYRAEPVWDGRAYAANGKLVVAAYTSEREQIAGFVDEGGHVQTMPRTATGPNASFPDFTGVRYNPFTGQLWRRVAGGSIVDEQAIYLPLPLIDREGRSILPAYRIVSLDGGGFALVGRSGDAEITLARCSLNRIDAMQGQPGYAPVIGPGCTLAVDEPTVVFEIPGEIAADALDASTLQLVLKQPLPDQRLPRPMVKIDGRFDDWRSISGIADPSGDVVSYLQYNPDTDLQEFKVAGDDEYLYFYTRVAGRHGNTQGARDRYYFYVYIDADRDPATGYIPTRDDDCYFGVTLGDDCEAQFEFVDGRFVKTFFGFAGGSTEQDVLAGRVALAPSWYSKHDEAGRLRDGYKVEYVNQGGEVKITEDNAEGTTDDIVIALSPDGSECEMRARLSGFLRDVNGNPILGPGQSIDLAAGVEASGRIRGNTKWGADSTAVIRGYSIGK